MILWLGIIMFRARVEVVQKGKDLPYNAFTAGILTSVFNPFFLLWWATIGSMLIMRILEFGTMGSSNLPDPLTLGTKIAGRALYRLQPAAHRVWALVFNIRHTAGNLEEKDDKSRLCL